MKITHTQVSTIEVDRDQMIAVASVGIPELQATYSKLTDDELEGVFMNALYQDYGDRESAAALIDRFGSVTDRAWDITYE